MEENKNKQVSENTPQKGEKITYDQLKALYEQSMIQTKKYYRDNQELVKDNQELIKEIQNLRNQMNYAEINLAFKVLEYEKHFSPEFVSMIAERLETVLTPVAKTEENKED